jgi:hypothetical protein
MKKYLVLICAVILLSADYSSAASFFYETAYYDLTSLNITSNAGMTVDLDMRSVSDYSNIYAFKGGEREYWTEAGRIGAAQYISASGAEYFGGGINFNILLATFTVLDGTGDISTSMEFFKEINIYTDSSGDETYNGDFVTNLYIRNVTKGYELWQTDIFQRSAGAFDGEDYYELFNGSVCTESTYDWTNQFETNDYGEIGIWFSDEGLYVKDVSPVPEPATLLLLVSGLAGLAGLRKRTVS